MSHVVCAVKDSDPALWQNEATSDLTLAGVVTTAGSLRRCCKSRVVCLLVLAAGLLLSCSLLTLVGCGVSWEDCALSHRVWAVGCLVIASG